MMMMTVGQQQHQGTDFSGGMRLELEQSVKSFLRQAESRKDGALYEAIEQAKTQGGNGESKLLSEWLGAYKEFLAPREDKL